MKYNIANICFLLLVNFLNAQEVITLSEAIDTALFKNLRINIVRNELEIARNNNHAGNADMLPAISLNVGDTPASNNIRQEFSNGTTIIRDHVNSNSLNAQLAIGMTLFDGGRMFATRDRLQELESMGEMSVNAEIQNLISEVIIIYCGIVTRKQYLEVLQKLTDLSETRLQLTIAKRDAGFANEPDVLLAQLDKDRQNQATIAERAAIQNAFADLSMILHWPQTRVYDITSEMNLMADLNRSEMDLLFSKNPEYYLSASQVNIALFAEKEAAASRLPRVGITAAYGYSLNQSQAGFSLYNQAYGPAATFSLSIPLFSGFVNKTRYENAIIESKNAKLQFELFESSLQAEYEKAWQLYESARLMVEADRNNILMASNYLDLMKQRFELGQSTVIEYREAQRSFEETNFRHTNNLFLLKISETDILRLTGSLSKVQSE